MATPAQIQAILRSREQVKAIEEERKRLAEEDAKKRTFNLGSLLPAAIATIEAPFTGGASLASLPGVFAGNAMPYAIGEGLRASTGATTDYGKMAGEQWQKIAPLRPLKQPTMEESLRTGANVRREDILPLSGEKTKYGLGSVGIKSYVDPEVQLSNMTSQTPKRGFISNLLGGFGEGFQQGVYKQESPEQRKNRQALADIEANPSQYSKELTVDESGNIKRGYKGRDITDPLETLKKLRDAGIDVAPLLSSYNPKTGSVSFKNEPKKPAAKGASSGLSEYGNKVLAYGKELLVNGARTYPQVVSAVNQDSSLSSQEKVRIIDSLKKQSGKSSGVSKSDIDAIINSFGKK